ncbi:MAG: alpha-E domain-containing protein [Terrimicrobiaceae bacterium]|nr:alpha-E domain-containing protein [Terrimicrobiaceae bacterium]
MLSRVADSCYWLSRYIERAETNARLLSVNMSLMLDLEDAGEGSVREHWEPVLASLEDQELFGTLFDHIDGESVREFVTFEKKNPNSIISCVSGARENARTVREQISSAMWEHINKLYLYLRSEKARSDYRNTPHDFYRSVIDGSHLFQGITDATMTHGEGWLFIQVGKFLERADSTSRVLDLKYHTLLPMGERVGGNVDLTQWMAVLRSCSALEAYLKIRVGHVAAWEVAEFLILHPTFPRSIRYSVDHMDRAIHRISGSGISAFHNEPERLSGMLRSSLDYATVESIFETGLHQYLDRTQLRLIEIADKLSKTYCEWLDESVEPVG